MKTKLHKLIYFSCLVGSVFMGISTSCLVLTSFKTTPPPTHFYRNTQNEVDINAKNDALEYLIIENGIVKGFKVGVNVPNDFTLIIPATNGVSKISRIAHHAFENRCEIKRVLIEEGIQQIRECAFNNCLNLQSVNLPYTLSFIGPNAFSNCPNLQSIIIPEKVVFIGQNCLNNCPKLGTNNVINHSLVLFDWWTNHHYYYNQTLSEMAIINLANHANSSNQPFAIIAEGALSKLSNLQSLTIPSSISEIGRLAFSDCPQLNVDQFTNHSTVLFKSWINQHLYNNQSLASIRVINLANYPNSINQGFTKISEEAFSSCSDLEIIDLPHTITSIGKRAFNSCHLKQMTIPESVHEIGPQAFDECSELVSDNFVNHAPVLFDWWVENHLYQNQTLSQMQTINLNHFLNSSQKPFTKLAANCFSRCTNLQKIIIPKTISEIGPDAFNTPLSSLKNVIIEGDDLKFSLTAFEGVSAHAQYYVNDQGMKNKLLELGINADQINVACDDWFIKTYDQQCELTLLTPQGRANEHLTIPANVNKINPHAFNEHLGSLKSINIKSKAIKLENNLIKKIPDHVTFKVSDASIKDDLVKLGIDKKRIKLISSWKIATVLIISAGVIVSLIAIILLIIFFWRRYQRRRISY